MNTYTDTRQNSLIVLRKGEELVERLGAHARSSNMAGCWMNAIGGASDITLGYYDPKSREYIWQDFYEPLEIIGLQGNLAWVDGEPFWHIHGIFSRRDYTTIAGHVRRCVIGLTGEIFLTEHTVELTRSYDDETGLKLLDNNLTQ